MGAVLRAVIPKVVICQTLPLLYAPVWMHIGGVAGTRTLV
jgi:hypothetical protein